MQTAYKIFETKNNLPRTLFHGLNGSRALPLNKWLTAEKKMVTDGSRSTYYKSGFHAYKNLDEVKKWLKSAKKIKGRYVVKVSLNNTWHKPQAVRPTVLAEKIRISSKRWKSKIKAEDL